MYVSQVYYNIILVVHLLKKSFLYSTVLFSKFLVDHRCIFLVLLKKMNFFLLMPKNKIYNVLFF